MQPQEAGRLVSITERYARFSMSAAGLGNVVGGVLVLITYFLGALQPPGSVIGRLALACAPLLWIGSKELLRRHYYQRLGSVKEAWPASDRRWHIGFTIFTTVVSAGIFGAVLMEARTDLTQLLEPDRLGYLLFVAALPVLVWFFMRTPLEFIVGTFLVAQAAVILGGSNYELGQQPQAPIAGLLLIYVGLRQHREFLALDRELKSLRGRG